MSLGGDTVSALSVAHMKQAAERVQEVQGQSYQKIYGGQFV